MLVTQPEHPRREPPAALVAQARDYIAAAEWSFAKTMPDNPHWYAVRQRSRAQGLGAGHEALYVLLRDYHYDRWWHGRSYRTLDIDGFGYWIMEDGTIINRKPVDSAGWDS
jgi:hypothetical protein